VERVRPVGRAAVYAITGWSADFTFNRVSAAVRGERLFAIHTSPWMLPVYALIQPLYEPAHDRLRARPLALRGVVYGAGFIAAEYASGRILRRLRGEAPWDYSHARFQVHGVTRLDYFPVWALAGIALERLHNRIR
jgi:uncharacterized membrane protein